MRIFCNKISELKKKICALPCLFKYFAPFTCAICSFAYKVLRCPLNVFEASECYRRLKMFLIYLFFGYFTLTVEYGELNGSTYERHYSNFDSRYLVIHGYGIYLVNQKPFISFSVL